MEKIMTKTFSIFTLAFLFLSTTGAAAATCTSCNAKPETFQLSANNHYGNVLSTSQINGGLRVVSMSSCTHGKVSMNSKGHFSYTPKTCSMTGNIKDSFVCKIKNSCGKTCTGRVTIYYKCK